MTAPELVASISPSSAPPPSPVPCAVCGATGPRALFRPPASPGPVVRCAECGMVYVSPRERTASLIFDGDQFAADPLRHSADPTSWWGIGKRHTSSMRWRIGTC